MSRTVALLLSIGLLIALPAPAQRHLFVVPSFRDTLIRTRLTRGLQTPMITTVRLKGSRQRIETEPDTARHFGPFTAHIMQCDERTFISLFLRAKTYRLNHWHEPQERHPLPQHHQQADGPIVTITVDSVDTGERRTMGSYEAHHVKTTITVDPSDSAITKPEKTLVDGWYLDLEGFDCRAPSSPDQAPIGVGGWILPMKGSGHDRIVYKFLSTSPRGYPVEETTTERGEGNLVRNEVELVEFSEQALDDSLFEVPPDYTQASPPGNGLRRVPFGAEWSEQ